MQPTSLFKPGKRIAVMQPYFYPYAGYFRLLAQADELVLLDCVQFPRRGRVHRCEMPGPGAGVEWLTLPIAAQAQSTLIRELRFSLDARARLDARLARFPWLRTARTEAAIRVLEHLSSPLDSVVDFLEQGLLLVARELGLETPMVRSSTLGLDPTLRGQQRILAIAKARGAEVYINAPGGRHLYEEFEFNRQGVELRFLSEYSGRHKYMLEALVSEPAGVIRQDVLRGQDPG